MELDALANTGSMVKPHTLSIGLAFSDTRCAKRRHSAAYCRKRSASLSMTRFTFWMFQCSELQTGNDRSG